MEYLIHILILIGIYTILSVSLNMISGYTGLVSVAHAAFFGIGAYVAGLMALMCHSPFMINVLCAVILTALFGIFIGLLSLRIHDDYFVIVTFAFQVITFSIFNNWDSLTGGALGLSGIPRPKILWVTISSDFGFLVLVAFFDIAILLIARRIVRSPFGRVLKAIREDEVFAQAAGKNVAAYKILIFLLGGGIAAVAGVIYAYYISFIDPTSFTIMESIFILAMVIIGGAGSLWGSVAGAIILVSLPELCRFLGLPSSVAANLRQILYGSLLVLFMLLRPCGFLGEHSFQSKGIKE
jgi:branched-chain amino acid transport system permease protein